MTFVFGSQLLVGQVIGGAARRKVGDGGIDGEK